MTLPELQVELERRGVVLCARGDKLVATPKELAIDLTRDIAAHKEDLIAALPWDRRDGAVRIRSALLDGAEFYLVGDGHVPPPGAEMNGIPVYRCAEIRTLLALQPGRETLLQTHLTKTTFGGYIVD